MVGEIEMSEFYGACKFCGQQQIIAAADQEDANIKATKDCDCPDAVLARKRQAIIDQVRSICCGEDAKEAKFQLFDAEQMSVTIELAKLIQLGNIMNVKITAADSILKMSLSKDKEVRISRERQEKIEVEV